MDSSVLASVVFLGILPLVCSVPVLEDGLNKDDPLWMQDAADGDDIFCKQRLDGVYRDPLSCSLYHRCSEGRRQTLRCGSTLQFDAETGRCEAPRSPCVTLSACVLRGDGVYANRSDACGSYYRCENGSVSERGSCEGRRFNEASQRCEASTSTPCVELVCPSGAGGRFYPTPGAACRGYYRCHQGLPASFLCPEGFAFDVDSQACTQRTPTCLEPVCVGRVNGRYPDAGCSRWFLCEGGVVTAVGVCAPGLLFDGAECRRRTEVACPAPLLASAPKATPRTCVGLGDGAHADAEVGCRDYVLCADGRQLHRKRCPEGTLFDGRMCVPAPLVSCPAPRRPADPCAKLDDGFHHDLTSGCRGYRLCAAGRTTLWGRCGEDAVWDGERCVPASDSDAEAPCSGPEPWPGCKEGLHRDADDCRRYQHCGAGNRTRLVCPRGRVFDGRRCVPAARHACGDSCAGRPDGYYRDPALGCRSYFYCSDGNKITYVCPGSSMFDGKECVDAASFSCPFASDDCRGLSDGYHPDASSSCRSYFYCIDGYKITAFTCADGKVFDGRRCVEPSTWTCPAAAAPSRAAPDCASSDGFFQDLASGCRSYYFCIGGAKTLLRCAGGQVFDGQLCVDPGTYSCPTETPTPPPPAPCKQ